jgi:hypothetical protein
VASGRASFVLTVMVLLGAGLVATLWLSTAATADSYRLQDARTAARELSERSERLHREVAALQSPPALAQRATQLGMVPAKNPARLVVAPDGGVRVVGEPVPAVAPPVVAGPPGGLDGGVAPAARQVPGPEAAPEQVAAAAAAAARPAVEEARRAAEEQAAEEQAAEEQAAEAAEGEAVRGGTDGADEDADERGTGRGDQARDDTAGGDSAGQDSAGQDPAGRGGRGSADDDGDADGARGTAASSADDAGGTSRTRAGDG